MEAVTFRSDRTADTKTKEGCTGGGKSADVKRGVKKKGDSNAVSETFNVAKQGTRRFWEGTARKIGSLVVACPKDFSTISSRAEKS